MNIALSTAFTTLKIWTDMNVKYLDFLSSIITAFIDLQKAKKHASSILRSNREGNETSGGEILFDIPDENQLHLSIIDNQRR